MARKPLKLCQLCLHRRLNAASCPKKSSHSQPSRRTRRLDQATAGPDGSSHRPDSWMFIMKLDLISCIIVSGPWLSNAPRTRPACRSQFHNSSEIRPHVVLGVLCKAKASIMEQSVAVSAAVLPPSDRMSRSCQTQGGARTPVQPAFTSRQAISLLGPSAQGGRLHKLSADVNFGCQEQEAWTRSPSLACFGGLHPLDA